MRFLLAFVLSFVSLFAIAQAPPMALGGPQGITSTRINAQSWLSIPIYVDTPVGPLVGIGWPPRGFMIQTIKNYRNATVEEYLKWTETAGLTQTSPTTWQSNDGTIYTLPKGIDSTQVLNYILASDTAIWHYTGRQWKRAGGNAEFYFNSLVIGGFVTQVAPISSRKFTVSAAEYIINGVNYRYDTTQTLIAPSKVADSTGRIDVITLRPYGAILLKGTPSTVPLKPRVGGDEIELTSIYYAPFSTVPSVIGSGSKGVSSIFRVPGKDSIFYTVDTLKFGIKDSVGITKNDTAAMLKNYKFTAANGLSKDSTVFRLGGILNQNTNINLDGNRLTFIGGTDTTRFFADGRISIAGSPDSNNVHYLINKKNSRFGNLEILSGANAGLTGQGIRIDGTDRTFKFQGTGSSAAGATFQFTGWPGDTVPSNAGQPHLSRDIIRVSQGYVRGAGLQAVDTGRYNVLNIEPKYNIWYDSGRTLIRGIYYNPTIQALNKTNHVAYQNTTGSNLMNSTSGNTRIGYALVDTNNTYKLDVNGTTKISGNITFLGTISSVENVSPFSERFGHGTVATGQNSLSVGRFASATGSSSVAIGTSSISTANSGIAILGSAAGVNSIVIGGGATSLSTAANGIAIGSGSNANGGGFGNPIAIGSNAISSGANSIAFGRSASVTANNSIAIGTSASATSQNQLVFGSGADSLWSINDIYFGSGVRNASKLSGVDYTINGSGAGDSTNMAGGSVKIAGGKGTGTGTPGSVIFSTSSDTTSGTALQTLKERARISPSGNLLVGTTTDNGYRVSAVGGTIANGVYGRGYIPFKADYVNDGNTIFSVGNTSDTSVVSIRNGGISESYRVLRIFGTRSGEEVRVNGTSGTNTNQDTTALFEIVSTNAGFLQPRMTNVQRDSISSRPTQGLQIFSTTDSANYVYRGTGGGWQKIANEISGSDTLDFPSTGHGNSADLTITVTGASEGDVVALGIPNASIVANASYIAWVSATNTVTVRFNNYASSGNSDPASGTFKIKVLK